MNMTPKERMLKNIRKALLESRDNPYPEVENRPLYPAIEDTLDIVFAEQLMAAGGKFVFCADLVEFLESLVLLTEQDNWHHIYCWEPQLQHLLNQCEFPYHPAEEKFMTSAEVGLTTCEALIARNGSVLVSSNGASGRRLSIYPERHAVLAFTSQICLDLKDGLAVLKEKYEDSLPSMLSIVTGPSRTADIEKTLVMGAHGPKELIVFLVEDMLLEG